MEIQLTDEFLEAAQNCVDDGLILIMADRDIDTARDFSKPPVSINPLLMQKLQARVLGEYMRVTKIEPDASVAEIFQTAIFAILKNKNIESLPDDARKLAEETIRVTRRCLSETKHATVTILEPAKS